MDKMFMEQIVLDCEGITKRFDDIFRKKKTTAIAKDEKPIVDFSHSSKGVLRICFPLKLMMFLHVFNFESQERHSGSDNISIEIGENEITIRFPNEEALSKDWHILTSFTDHAYRHYIELKHHKSKVVQRTNEEIMSMARCIIRAFQEKFPEGMGIENLDISCFLPKSDNGGPRTHFKLTVKWDRETRSKVIKSKGKEAVRPKDFQAPREKPLPEIRRQLIQYLEECAEIMD